MPLWGALGGALGLGAFARGGKRPRQVGAPGPWLEQPTYRQQPTEPPPGGLVDPVPAQGPPPGMSPEAWTQAEAYLDRINPGRRGPQGAPGGGPVTAPGAPVPGDGGWNAQPGAAVAGPPPGMTPEAYYHLLVQQAYGAYGPPGAADGAYGPPSQGAQALQQMRGQPGGFMPLSAFATRGGWVRGLAGAFGRPR